MERKLKRIKYRETNESKKRKAEETSSVLFSPRSPLASVVKAKMNRNKASAS